MSNFVNQFTSGPVGTNPAKDLDSYIREDTKKAINERYSIEHIALDAAGATDISSPTAQGRHIPGKVGVLLYAAEATILAISNPGVGAIAYASDTNRFLRYGGNGWLDFALNSSSIVPDGLTVEIVAPVAPSLVSTIQMKHAAQQWTTTYVLTDGATINTDCNNSNSFSITLGGNRILANPTNLQAGATYVWIVTQDGTGNRTLTFGTKFKFPYGSTSVLTAAGGSVDVIAALYDGTNLLCSVIPDVR